MPKPVVLPTCPLPSAEELLEETAVMSKLLAAPAGAMLPADDGGPDDTAPGVPPPPLTDPDDIETGVIEDVVIDAGPAGRDFPKNRDGGPGPPPILPIPLEGGGPPWGGPVLPG